MNSSEEANLQRPCARTFGLAWGGIAYDASVNDWVADVERMAWTTKHYWTWLYENRRREWVVAMTLFSMGFELLSGLSCAAARFRMSIRLSGLRQRWSF